MAEVLFYHLTERPLANALPGLAERSLERGWKVVIQAGSEERLRVLDALLWTYSEESFLPHSMVRDGTEAWQPVWLTLGTDNPNAAQVRFLVDGAECDDLGDYVRAVYIFDGHDHGAVEHARMRWRVEKAAGHVLPYWQQTSGGGWARKA